MFGVRGCVIAWVLIMGLTHRAGLGVCPEGECISFWKSRHMLGGGLVTSLRSAMAMLAAPSCLYAAMTMLAAPPSPAMAMLAAPSNYL